MYQSLLKYMEINYNHNKDYFGISKEQVLVYPNEKSYLQYNSGNLRNKCRCLIMVKIINL